MTAVVKWKNVFSRILHLSAQVMALINLTDAYNENELKESGKHFVIVSIGMGSFADSL